MQQTHYPSSPFKIDADQAAASVIAQIKREARGSEFEYASSMIEELKRHRLSLQEAIEVFQHLAESLLQHYQKKLASVEQLIRIVEDYRRHL